jgi:hypothetical protein
MGPSYKVIYCACYRDKTLKDRSQWCEFCLCRKCGGKFAQDPAAHDPAVRRSQSGAAGQDGSGGFNDFSPDLGLLVGLLGLAAGAVVYAGEVPYKHMYLMGMVCFAYCARDFCCSLSTTITKILA